METQAILDAIMQRLVDTVADEVIRKLKAEGAATVSLESDAMQTSLVALLLVDTEVRESIRDIVTDTIDNIRLSDNTDFVDLEHKVDRLDEKVEELMAAVARFAGR